jgi:hypothetical protein
LFGEHASHGTCDPPPDRRQSMSRIFLATKPEIPSLLFFTVLIVVTFLV